MISGTVKLFFENEGKEYFNEELVIWKDKLKNLLDYNLDYSENKIILNDKVITINSKTYVEGIFSNILNIKGFKIESEYQGYIENDKVVIKRIK